MHRRRAQLARRGPETGGDPGERSENGIRMRAAFLGERSRHGLERLRRALERAGEEARDTALGIEQRTEMAEAWHGAIKEGLTGPTGLSPAQVADRVLQAIQNGEFWIITHDDLLPTVRDRVNGMLAAFPGQGA